ncbi:DoxX family protein [Candidatus Kaiserbacteria bacterium]|nr:DoxX family protein [Candidatus Kaiserbacteria bacterium]
MNTVTSHDIGTLVLRLGLAAVFLWFGLSQLMDSVNWVSWVPAWVPALLHLPPAMIVLANGIFDTSMGALIAMNLFTRIVALLAAVHILFITFEIGFNEIGVRDFGLSMATLALFFLTGGLDLFRRNRERD